MKSYFTRTVIAAVAFFVTFSATAQKYTDGLVDKTVAVIGGEMIMLSQIESELQMMRYRGTVTDMNARCEMLESMLESKLLYVQAKKDSLNVNEANVEQALQGRIDEVVATLGGEKAVEEYFHMPMYKLRKEWKTAITEQSLIQQMQQQVSSKVDRLTPSDVRDYFKKSDAEELPIVSTRYRLRQIAIYPDREAANLAVKEKLLSLRERIINGEKFTTLARLYSEDPGSMTKGGELGMMSKNIFWPAFSDAAMSLKIGQVSQVVETPDGFHLIQVLARDGDMFNARHILIKPSYNDEDRNKAFDKLDSLRTRIISDSISFVDAARLHSQDKKTATSGGLLADENTGSSYFEKDQLKPADYNVIKDMKEGDISEPFQSLDNEGRNGNTVYKIITLEKIIPSHTATFEEDYNEILNLVQSKMSEDAINKFIAEKQRTTYIRVDPSFHGCVFRHEGWIK